MFIAYSYPIWTDLCAGGEASGDGTQHFGGPIQDSGEPSERQAIDHLFALAFRGHESAVAQAGQVWADSWLRLPDDSHELPDSPFPHGQELKDLQPPGIRQNAKEARGRGGRRAMNKRGIHIP